MNDPSLGIGQTSDRKNIGMKSPRLDPVPNNWREAIMGLIASRISLIQLESKDVGKGAVKWALLIAAACGCLFSAWMLLLAGGVAAVADVTQWQWYWVAMGAALLHLMAAIILFRLLKPSENPVFPVTRSEFQKDREWIENFQKIKKSND
jgi:uncharacterized membrane protein YqjE